MRKELLFSFILLFAMASWGLSWPLSKVMTQYLSPLELVCIRFVIAAISFVPVIYMLKLSFFVPKTAIKGVLLTSFFNIAYSGMFFFGLSLGGAGSAGVITTTLAPIFSSLIGAFIYHTRLRKSEKIGLVLGVLAGGILIGFDGLMNLYSLVFLSTAFLWCCVTLSSRLATSNMQAIVLNFYASLLSGIIFFPFFVKKNRREKCASLRLKILRRKPLSASRNTNGCAPHRLRRRSQSATIRRRPKKKTTSPGPSIMRCCRKRSAKPSPDRGAGCWKRWRGNSASASFNGLRRPKRQPCAFASPEFCRKRRLFGLKSAAADPPDKAAVLNRNLWR